MYNNYKISDYSKQKARELNVTIKPSKNKKKKIDVYKNGEVIAFISKKMGKSMLIKEKHYINYVIRTI